MPIVKIEGRNADIDFPDDMPEDEIRNVLNNLSFDDNDTPSYKAPPPPEPEPTYGVDTESDEFVEKQEFFKNVDPLANQDPLANLDTSTVSPTDDMDSPVTVAPGARDQVPRQSIGPDFPGALQNFEENTRALEADTVDLQNEQPPEALVNLDNELTEITKSIEKITNQSTPGPDGSEVLSDELYTEFENQTKNIKN